MPAFSRAVFSRSYVWSIAGQEDFACTYYSADSDEEAVAKAEAMARDSIRELGRTSAEIQVRRVALVPFHVGPVALEPVHAGDSPTTLEKRRS
jgi:hypothetical protein